MKEITRKCRMCDGKNEQSINIEVDDFVMIKKGKISEYYHTQCYLMYLITKKRMTEQESLLEIQRIKSLMIEDVEDKKYREKLCELIMNLYNISFLPNYFFIRLSEINKGTYKNIKEPISNLELFEMYSNQKLIAKLEKIAIKKGIEKDNRLYWDLSIILNEYEAYKRWKRNNVTKDINIIKIKEDMQKIKQMQTNIKQVDDDDVDITELIL
ncbi:MAG: hypothetical protein M0P14_07320 [Alkaliphilus sp.]|nr:hypothetical protein [Alkaliphilus sp.]